MDKVTFFTQVLQYVGDRQYKEGTPGFDACNLWFPDVMREALKFGAWSFATVAKRLEREEGREGFELPEDCLRLLKVSAERYRKLGRRIYPEDEKLEELEVEFVSDGFARVEHLPKEEPRFVQGVRLLLAGRIMAKLEGDLGKGVQLERMAWESLEDALHDDVVQFASNDQHPLEDIVNNSILG